MASKSTMPSHRHDRCKIMRELYRCGLYAKSRIDEALEDKAQAPARGELLPPLFTRALSPAEVRGVVSRTTRDVAKEFSVPIRAVAMSYRFTKAVDVIAKIGGKRARATVMSSAFRLTAAQIIRLSRRSAAAIELALQRVRRAADTQADM